MKAQKGRYTKYNNFYTVMVCKEEDCDGCIGKCGSTPEKLPNKISLTDPRPKDSVQRQGEELPHP